MGPVRTRSAGLFSALLVPGLVCTPLGSSRDHLEPNVRMSQWWHHYNPIRTPVSERRLRRLVYGWGRIHILAAAVRNEPVLHTTLIQKTHVSE